MYPGSKAPRCPADGLDALLEVLSLGDIAIERLPRLKADARRKKKPLPIERGKDQTVYTDPYQAALMKTFFMPACIGAAISVVSF